MTHTLTVMGMMPPLLRRTWDETAKPTGRETAVRRRAPGRTARWVAAAAAMAAALVLALLPGPRDRLLADHSTGTAEVREIRLDDGSTVRLAPESAIDVTYSASRREIRLRRGEAFFEVAADHDRPFVVAAQGLETTDIGTAFTVRTANEGTDVAVREGMVEVDGTRGGLPVHERLAAGERARIAWTGAVERGRLPPEQVAAWLHGQLVVKQRPVAEIVDALRPYFRGLIVVRGDALPRQTLTGVYSLSRPADALSAIAAAQGATLHRFSPWLLVLSES